MDPEFFSEIDELMGNGKFDEVVKKIQALDDDEMNEELALTLAHALTSCGRAKEALDVLEDMKEDVCDDDLGYHLELAGTFYSLHKYHSAVREAEMCLGIDENCLDVWLLLCYIYQDIGDDENFDRASEAARDIDETAWNNLFGEETVELEIYSDDDVYALMEHISKNFGNFNFFPIHEQDGSVIAHPINVVFVPPDKKRNFYTVISVGIGAYKGNDVMDDGTPCLHRVELVSFLPPYLTPAEMMEKYEWVARIMRQFGEMIQVDETWLGYGHTVAYGSVLDNSVDFDGVILDNLTLNSAYGEICMLPSGEPVQFLQMRPLYEEEMLFKIEYGPRLLFDRLNFMPKHGYAYDKFTAASEAVVDIIDIVRPNCCSDKKEKPWAIPKSGLVELLEWDDADGCFATDRITVDKCRVGLMYREHPYPSKPDSGWRFFAGDEDEQYMSDMDKMDIFSLNTICNYDPDIIEFLDSPVGSVFWRNKHGVFVPYYGFLNHQDGK